MNSKNNSRLLTLDAMRGLAAIVVVFYHLEFVAPFAPSGYLAVDFFFLMSGIVIAKAYICRLNDGLSIKSFLVERIIRLMPLYALGMLVGFIRIIGKIITNHPGQMSWSDLSVSMAFNALFLPSPVTNELSPINVPSWSLFFELFVNVVWAAFLVKLPKKFLNLYVAILGVALAISICLEGSADRGANWTGFYGGALRSFFGFGLGVIMASYVSNKSVQNSRISIFTALLLCVSLFLRVPAGYKAAYDCLAIFAVFPLVVFLGSLFNPPRALQKLSEILGDVSYPIYILHFAPMFAITYAAKKFNVPPVIWIPVFIFGLFFVCLYLAKTYDAQARMLMKGIVKRNSPRTV